MIPEPTNELQDGMMEEQPRPLHVPWTTRDMLLGSLSILAWMVLFVAVGMLLPRLNIFMDVGLYIGLAELAMVIPVWWFTVRKYHVGFDRLGLRGFRVQYLLWGFGLMMLSFGFNALYSLLLASFDLQIQVDVAPVFAELNSPWWLMAAGVIVAPVAEEIFFRGFIFGGLRERYPWWQAAAISSGIFALLHMQLTAFLPIFILGMIFSFLYQRSGSILPGLYMHIFTNALGLGAAYLVSLM